MTFHTSFFTHLATIFEALWLGQTLRYVDPTSLLRGLNRCNWRLGVRRCLTEAP